MRINSIKNFDLKRTMENNQSTTSAFSYADSARVLAILAVICLHAAAVRVVHLPEVNTVGWWTANSIDSLCRWAVPVFIMLSGALNLDLQKNYSFTEYITKRFTKIGIPFLFWTLIYFYYAGEYYKIDLSLDYIKKSLWEGLTCNHLYFLIIIIGLYVVTPLIKISIRSLPLWCVYAIVCIFMYITTSGLYFHHVQSNALTKFIPYIMYYILGLLLNRNFLYNKLIPIYAICFGISSLIIIIKTYMLVVQFGQGDYRAFLMYEHFNIFVIIQSISAFQLFQYQFSYEGKGKYDHLLKNLAKISFGVYLIHIIFLDKTREFTYGWGPDHLIFIILLEVCVAYSMSVIACFIIDRVPYMRKTIGL